MPANQSGVGRPPAEDIQRPAGAVIDRVSRDGHSESNVETGTAEFKTASIGRPARISGQGGGGGEGR